MNSDAIKNLIEKEFYNFHRQPELSFEEFLTTARLKKLLIGADIEILDLPLKTGLVAKIGSGEPVIALRADIDALPIEEMTDLPYKSTVKGKMHACGHDFHMTAVLGAALMLKEQEDKLKGTIKIIFQPAEEAPGGAKVIIDTGVMKDIKAVFGLHTLPVLEVGTLAIKEGAVTGSVDRFNITFTGKGTHAAHPQRGIDPIPLMAAFIEGAQTIVARNIYPFDAALVSITHVEAGSTWNIIPETALVEGTTRNLTADNRKLIKKRIYELAQNLASAYGGTAAIDWYAGPPATNNDSKWCKVARKVALENGFTLEPPANSLAGEDFAYYQENIPGCFVLVGTGLSASNHNPKFKVDVKALYPTAKYLANLASAALNSLNKK